jgi:hypothetical protein
MLDKIKYSASTAIRKANDILRNLKAESLSLKAITISNRTKSEIKMSSIKTSDIG